MFESAAGISAGGRTGLTAVTTAVLHLILILPFVGIVPAAATSPALIIVGVMMVSSFLDGIGADLKMRFQPSLQPSLWHYASLSLTVLQQPLSSIAW